MADQKAPEHAWVRTCAECGRVFDLLDNEDVAEWTVSDLLRQSVELRKAGFPNASSGAFKMAQSAATWLFGEWPIDPDEESERFANRYGLTHYATEERGSDYDPDFSTLGKFSSEFDERVYEMALESDEILSTMNDGGGEWVAVVRFSVGDLLNTLRILTLAPDDLPYVQGVADRDRPALPYGAIVVEDERGFVTVDCYRSAYSLDSHISRIEEAMSRAQDAACEEQKCKPCPNCNSYECGSCTLDPESGSSHIIGCARDWIG